MCIVHLYILYLGMHTCDTVLTYLPLNVRDGRVGACVLYTPLHVLLYAYYILNNMHC